MFLENSLNSQVFSCEFCEISKNTFFTGQLRTTASENLGDILLDFGGVFRNILKICNRALKVHRRCLTQSEKNCYHRNVIEIQTVSISCLLTVPLGVHIAQFSHS